MGDNTKTHSTTDVLFRWFQIVAITLAGLWAVFQFGLFEVKKNYVLEVNVSADVGKPVGEGIVPVKITTSARNSGQKGVNLIFAKAIFAEEDVIPKRPDDRFDIRDWSTLTYRPYKYMRDIGERVFAFATAYEIFTPYYYLERNETQWSEILFLANTARANFFTYQIFYYAAERCRGIYPFETCFEFRADTFEPQQGEPCPGDLLWVGVTNLCIQYFRKVLNSDSTDWEEITEDDLFKDHKMIFYRRDGNLYLWSEESEAVEH